MIYLIYFQYFCTLISYLYDFISLEKDTCMINTTQVCYSYETIRTSLIEIITIFMEVSKHMAIFCGFSFDVFIANLFW